MCTYGSLCAQPWPQSRPQSRPYCTDGTRTAVFDRGSTHVPRCVIVVNGPPPVRLHLSVHVIVHGDCLVALVMDCCGPRVLGGPGEVV